MCAYSHQTIAWGKELAVCISERRPFSSLLNRRSYNFEEQ